MKLPPAQYSTNPTSTVNSLYLRGLGLSCPDTTQDQYFACTAQLRKPLEDTWTACGIGTASLEAYSFWFSDTSIRNRRAQVMGQVIAHPAQAREQHLISVRDEWYMLHRLCWRFLPYEDLVPKPSAHTTLGIQLGYVLLDTYLPLSWIEKLAALQETSERAALQETDQ